MEQRPEQADQPDSRPRSDPSSQHTSDLEQVADSVPSDPERPGSQGEALARFWQDSRHRAGLTKVAVVTGTSPTAAVPPVAWSFGSDPAEADALLLLLLDGRKTATASAADGYSAHDLPLPAQGDLGIVLDGAGRPRALVRTTSVRVVPFDEVDAEHADAEAEGDLEHWRSEHRRLLAAELGSEVTGSTAVVLERLEVLHRA